MANDEGLQFGNKQYLNLNSLIFSKMEIFISFWLKLSAVNVQTFTILTALSAAAAPARQEIFSVQAAPSN